MNPDSAGGQHSRNDAAPGEPANPAATPPRTHPGAALGLPDPEPLLINLSRCIIEVLAGARELEQLARWVSDDVYKNLLTRTVLSNRARSITQRPPVRPTFTIGRIRVFEPRPGAVEAVVMVHSRTRARVVALRLEAMDDRWRASAIHVL
ncbi:MAG: Rv3235 family protein [Cryobacterium sp.]